jgi:steroid 5-alpha reductase family enzyme
MISKLVIALLIPLVINLALFIVAFKTKSDKLTDAAYSISFISIAVYAYFSSSESSYDLLLCTLAVIWALRIGSFLVYRVLKVGFDRRFDDIRNSFVKFAEFWLGQAVTSWIVMLPILFASNAKGSNILIIGLAVWLLGLLTEAIADIEKYQFKNNPKNKNKWISHGLWHFSRHPNYFGEILVWLGIYLFTLPDLNTLEIILGSISPIFIAFLLLFVSGVPLLEKNADKRWGNNQDYLNYKKSTSIIIPLPPRK